MSSSTKTEKLLNDCNIEDNDTLLESNNRKHQKSFKSSPFSFFRKKCLRKINPRKYNDLVWLSKRIISMAGIKNIFPEVGIICGSGLNNLADRMEKTIILPFDKLPGFPLPSVIGHKGNVIFGWLGGKYCICLQGRFHPYEQNMDMALCTMPVRLMALMGVKTLIASNAAGGVNPDLNVGDLMILKDHIFMPGLVGFSPLVGLNNPRFGNRFVSMQNAYDQKLRKKAIILAENLCISVKEGVYLMNAGPHYETMAEVSLAAKLGGDALGMSTCHEKLEEKISEKASEWIAQLINNLDDDIDEGKI
uniref:purine-nucleoside phosphorylase n=1 Tax=Meloidogyne hapla TaxID=6305 RepID=A0A1I8B4Y0_MELHA